MSLGSRIHDLWPLTLSFFSKLQLGNNPNSDIDSPTPPSSFHRRNSTRGSMRKMLPPLPDMETQMTMSAKMIDRRTSTPKGNHSYGPFFLEYSLLAEYNLLQKQKLPGVYVIPSSETSLCTYKSGIISKSGIVSESGIRNPESLKNSNLIAKVGQHIEKRSLKVW